MTSSLNFLLPAVDKANVSVNSLKTEGLVNLNRREWISFHWVEINFVKPCKVRDNSGTGKLVFKDKSNRSSTLFLKMILFYLKGREKESIISLLLVYSPKNRAGRGWNQDLEIPIRLLRWGTAPEDMCHPLLLSKAR